MKLCEEREHHQIKRRHLKNHDSAFWGPPLELKCGNSISVAMVPNGHRVYSLNPTFFVWHLRMMAKPSLAIFGLIIERWKLRFAEVIQHLKKQYLGILGETVFFQNLPSTQCHWSISPLSYFMPSKPYLSLWVHLSNNKPWKNPQNGPCYYRNIKKIVAVEISTSGPWAPPFHLYFSIHATSYSHHSQALKTVQLWTEREV